MQIKLQGTEHQPYAHLAQRSQEYWHARMSCSITASEVKNLFGNWNTKTFGTFLDRKAYRIEQHFTNAAVQHGIREEPNAADIYEVLYMDHLPDSVQLEETGLWIHEQMPFIGVSPDRLVVDTKTGSILCLVEIKCPVSGWKGDESLKKHIKDWVPQVALQYLVVAHTAWKPHLVVWDAFAEQMWVYEFEFTASYLRDLLIRTIWFHLMLEARRLGTNSEEQDVYVKNLRFLGSGFFNHMEEFGLVQEIKPRLTSF